MSHMAATPSSLSSIPTDLLLWWEEDFYSGKFICLPCQTVESRETSQQLHLSDELYDFSPTSSKDQLGGFDLSKKVPLLVNLCIDKILGLPIEVRGCVQVPPGLIPCVENQRKRKRFECIRLEWLLKELLHQEVSLTSRLHFQSKLPKVTQATTNVFPRNCRSAWETDVKARDHFNDGEMFQDGDEMSWCFLPVAVEGRDTSNWPIAALAHTVELMLPHRFLIREEKLVCGRDKTVEDVLNRELQASVARVKSALVKICPKLVHFCLDPALAYVWWGRGDVCKAEGMFLRIIDRIPYDLFAQPDTTGGPNMAGDVSLWTRQKALYLNEIGRLHSYFNQPQEAANFYKGAVDLISGFCQEIFPDCTMQGLMLQADAYDQGLMDTLKATQAAGLWDRVTSEPGCNPNLVQMAAESFLHCHAGYPLDTSATEEDQNTEWLLEARLRLRVLATSVPKVSLHLSLILAILGDNNAAEDAYMTYVQEYASLHPAFQQQIPGAVSMFIGAEMKNHPWWIFSTWAAKKSGRVTANKHLTVLPLHWRRVLRHCSCDMETFDGNQFNGSWEAPSRVAEVQGIFPYLRLTQDGRLTGSFLQNLPPLTSVSLHPFTGAVYLPEQFQEMDTLPFGDNQVIGGRSQARKYQFGFETFIPTPVLIFDDPKDGRSVSLLPWQYRHATVDNGGLPVAAETPCSKAKLVYSGCDGCCEINIAEVVMKAKREVILQLLRNEGYDQNQERMNDASDFLDLCILMSKNMQYGLFIAAESKDRNPFRDVKDKLSDMTKNQPFDNMLEPEVFILKRVILVGQSTTVLAFSTAICQDARSQYIDSLVFLDCSSMESFKEPVIQYPRRPDTIWNLLVKEGYDDNVGNILMASEVSINGRDKDRVFVFDNKGEVIHIHDELMIRQVSNVCVNTDKGNDIDMIVGTNRSRSKLILTDTNGTMQLQTKPLGMVGIIEHFITVFNMIFVSLRDRIAVFDSSTLEPVQIVQDATPTDDVDSQRHAERGVGVLLTGERSFLKVLYKYEVASSSSPSSAPFSAPPSAPLSAPASSPKDAHFRVILGVANHVFVLQRAKRPPRAPNECPTSTSPGPVTLITEVIVPGVPTEACFISPLAGFVVTASIFESSKLPLYRENLYWFDQNGNIRGIHPFLGQGPHGFYAVHLNEPNNRDAGKVSAWDREVRYLYFTDGLGGICCIKLDESLY